MQQGRTVREHGPPAAARRSGLQALLGLGRAILQKTAHGSDPVISPLDLSAIERAAADFEHLLRTEPRATSQEFLGVWDKPGQDAAAYLALFSLALRRSGTSTTGSGPEHAYARIREVLFTLIVVLGYLVEHKSRDRFYINILGPALLRTDALQCYSRLLAQAAQQLKAVAPPWQLHDAAGRPLGAVAGGSGEQRQQDQRPAHRGPRPQQLATDALALARSALTVVSALIVGCGYSSSKSSTDELPATEHQPMHAARAQLHSSWVLEHWAQVVLLGAAVVGSRGQPATGGDSHDPHNALYLICSVLCRHDLSVSGVLQRPCGCALAGAHMAQLCAALDGGDAFGAAKPEVLVMPAWESREFDDLERMDPVAQKYDSVAIRLGRAVDLSTPLLILQAWVQLLVEQLEHPPGAAEALPEPAGPGADAAEGTAASDAAAPPGSQVGAGCSAPETASGPGEGCTSTDAGGSLCKLPPYNRTATFHLCLRLAKGVLACWGRPLSSVRLKLPSHNSSTPAPLLPKEQSCALLHASLTCARLELLPAVWGRERVPRRARAQLRAWWETCVAAAQHPEALVVGDTYALDWPEWMDPNRQGARVAPCADATAAIEAGMLPCLTRMVDRMGAGSSGGAMWCPPSIYPGVGPCLPDLLQFGPLGQVGRLVSAVGRRLCGAVGELRAAVMEGGVAGTDGGVRAQRLENGVRQAMAYTRTCLFVLFLSWHGAAVTVAAGMDVPQEAAAHMAHRPGGRAHAGSAAQFALRSSLALAELLPALTVSVQLYAELLAGSGSGGEGSGQGGGRAEAAREVEGEGREPGCDARSTLQGYCAAVYALECATALLAKLCWEAGREQHGGGCSSGGCDAAAANGADAGGHGGAGGEGGGGGDGGGGGGGSGGVAPGSGCRGAADTEWRRLLLRDVRLMELLGAGVALAQQQVYDGLPSDPDCCATQDVMRTSLCISLLLAALTFPAELRAAVEGSDGAAGAAGTEAAAGAGAGDGSGGPGARPRRSMSLAVLRAVLAAEAEAGAQAAAGGDGGEGSSPGGDGECLEVVVRVLGGWDPSPGEAWEVARRCWRGHARKVGYAEDLADGGGDAGQAGPGGGAGGGGSSGRSCIGLRSRAGS